MSFLLNYRKCVFSSILKQIFKTNKCLIKVSYCQTLRLSSNAKTPQINGNNTSNSDFEFENLLRDENYEELYPRNWRTIARKEGVLLVMPRQKWGHKQMARNYAKELMSETIALINTLPNMKVLDSIMMSTLDLNTKYLFGSGNLQLLKRIVHSNPAITAVVFSIDMLSSIQTSVMESQLGVDIYDRYSIVLNIFKSQANTKEAKLQIALAEIPYIRNNLKALQKSGDLRQKHSLKVIGGLGQTWVETRKQMLSEREIKLNKLLEKIRLNRDVIRRNRVRKQLPVVAVVGYTNSGKTSLIKALTNDQRLVPKNQLFATLDVTVHAGRLPSGLKVLYTDTIGFISEIPTALIHSFKATLSEICLADVIVHVLDISHPNHRLHEQTVNKTLDEIKVPEKLKNTVIEVGNKIDLLQSEHNFETNDKLLVSATDGTGMDELIERIEKSILLNTGRLEKTLRVPNGGTQYQWLYKESAIHESRVDSKDHNFLLIKIYITYEAFEKFKHSFRDNYCEIE